MTERLEFGDARIAVGDETRFTKTVGESDIYGFAGITGDFAAPHMDEEYMRRSSFGERVAHGALLVGFMSTASARMAGRVMEATEEVTPMSLGYDRVRFTAPVRIGDTVTVRYTVRSVEADRNRSRAGSRQPARRDGGRRRAMKWVPKVAPTGTHARLTVAGPSSAFHASTSLGDWQESLGLERLHGREATYSSPEGS